MIDTELKKRLASAQNNEDAAALLRIVEELEKEGFQNIIDLDAYFGNVSIPLEEDFARLRENHPQEAAFLSDLLKELREEMEILFETTEMYEDEEFDQFVEDCRIMKERYTRMLRSEHLPALQKLAQKVLTTP